MGSLLDELIGVSVQMHAAIEKGDVEAFAMRAAARAVLLDQLPAFRDPDALDPEWRRKQEQLAQINERLLAAAFSHEQRLEQALEGAVRVKQAQQQYKAPPRSRTILNESLAV